jgi:hypothetical protein
VRFELLEQPVIEAINQQSTLSHFIQGSFVKLHFVLPCGLRG